MTEEIAASTSLIDAEMSLSALAFANRFFYHRADQGWRKRKVVNFLESGIKAVSGIQFFMRLQAIKA